jgi:NifU-like protein involved in Fe-S cluster formation
MEYWDTSLMRPLIDATHTHESVNKLCGDGVQLSAIIRDDVIQQLEFSSHGCCICQCAAAILVEHFRNKLVAEVEAFTRHDMIKLVRIHVPHAREGCVELSLECLRGLCGYTEVTR